MNVKKVLFITTMKYAGDWFFWIKLLEKGNLYFHPKPLNHFRHHINTTRSIKTLKEERNRYKEYFISLNYIKSKYNVQWKVHNHQWILNDFTHKINILNSYNNFILLKIFPSIYTKYVIKSILYKKLNK